MPVGHTRDTEMLGFYFPLCEWVDLSCKTAINAAEIIFSREKKALI